MVNKRNYLPRDIYILYPTIRVTLQCQLAVLNWEIPSSLCGHWTGKSSSWGLWVVQMTSHVFWEEKEYILQLSEPFSNYTIVDCWWFRGVSSQSTPGLYLTNYTKYTIVDWWLYLIYWGVWYCKPSHFSRIPINQCFMG